ncbi:P-loop containing nucleoside triphosphate hydrolase protein [Umbelopsis sp. PMI_123]|nr:P-loop containing nucleoside triphosphate hydrolase protein [Umbelopsis sp. PMI_123]
MAPLQIIGSGWGRTGTAAMREALVQLGYDVHHMVVIMTDLSSDCDVFVEAWDGKDVDWNRAFGKFNAAVDWPAAAFYKQLMEVYPDAKVIHTTRDPEKWYTSVMNTIMAVNSLEGQADVPPQMLQRQKMVRHIIFDGELKGSRDKETCVQMFKDHDEEVKRHVPADRLLWFETGVDGWDKLCSFLGKEVPNTPWPHVNKSEEFHTRVQKLSQGAPMDDLSPVKRD